MLADIKPFDLAWSAFAFEVDAEAQAALSRALINLPGLQVSPFACATRQAEGRHYSFLCRVKPRGSNEAEQVKKIQVYCPTQAQPYLTLFGDIQP